MKKKVRQYTQEYKQEAVALAEKLGSVAEASRQLGTSDMNIHAWKKSLNKSQPTKDLEEEVQALRKENAQLKKVNHILKAAAAFFSQDQLK